MRDFTEFERFSPELGDVLKITRSKISAMELHLAVPANISLIHMQQIMQSVDYGAMNGVKVVVTKVK